MSSAPRPERSEFNAGPQVAPALTVTWLPPEGWPAPPDGFCPPARWAPDPAWPGDGRDWTFWRVMGPDELCAEYNAEVSSPPWLRDLPREQAYRWQVETPARRLHTINSLESGLRSVAHWVRDAAEPDEDRERVPFANPVWPAFLRAAWSSADAVAAARDHLLWALRHDQAPTQAYFEWNDLAHTRIDKVGAVGSELARVRADMNAKNGLGLFVNGSMSAAVATDTSDWQQAEQVAASALREFGFDDARVTVSGADGGLDVEGRTVAAQVKYTARPVGRPMLQQLVGAAGGRATAFFSRAGYTAQALEFADTVGMALFVVLLPSTVRPVSTTAHQMARR